MKAIQLQLAAALALTFAIAACVPAGTAPTAVPPPAAARPATAPPASRPAAVQLPVSDGWMDVPVTAGAWNYTDYGAGAGKRALFSNPDNSFYFSLTCVTQPNGPEILFSRTGRPAKRELPMTIRTETVQRVLMAQQATPALIAVTVRSSDPLLDAMALSKGRFAVEVEGETPLILPAWAEVSRVIEDCR